MPKRMLSPGEKFYRGLYRLFTLCIGVIPATLIPANFFSAHRPYGSIYLNGKNLRLSTTQRFFYKLALSYAAFAATPASQPRMARLRVRPQ